MAALTSPASKQFLLGQVVFWVCLSLTGVILPFMATKAYRIGLAEAATSNISTFCAPLSLLSASYLAAFSKPQEGMVLFLLISSQVLYAFVVCNCLVYSIVPLIPAFQLSPFHL